MIVFTLALIAWYVDRYLGIIMAVCLPSIVAMDTDGSYSEVYVAVFFSLAMLLVKRISLRSTNDEELT